MVQETPAAIAFPSTDDPRLAAVIAELAPSIASDPRVRATLRIGVTGHRDLPTHSVGAITTTAATIVQLIKSVAGECLRDGIAAVQYRPGLDLIVLSPLAEGADRLLVNAALSQGCRLGAILPFGAPEYEATFDLGDRTKAVLEFRELLKQAELPDGHGILTLEGASEPPGRDESFFECARVLNRWSDVLITILSPDRWNSQTGRGAREAIDLGIPTIVIDPHTPDRFSVWVDTVENRPGLASETLSSAIKNLLVPKHLKQGAPLLKRFIEENVVQKGSDLGWGVYAATPGASILVRWCSGLNRAFLKLGTPKVDNFSPTKQLDIDARAARPVVELSLRYHRADAVANAYAELHRSAQIAVVLLGVAAVALAALDAFAFLHTACVVVPASFFEVVFILFVFLIIRSGHDGAWLERWLDARLLAEIYRYSHFLLLTGRPTPFLNDRVSLTTIDDARSWTREHAEHVLRAQSMNVPGRGQQTKVGAVEELKIYVADRCIEDQLSYQDKTIRQRRGISNVLKRLSEGALFLTVGVVFVKFVYVVPLLWNFDLGQTTERVLSVLAVVTPTVAAALLALRAFGEHDLIVQRATVMVENLRLERPRMSRAANLSELSDAMLRVARLLLSEVDGWLEVFADKRIE
jgi:hypothetical protein